MAADMVRNGRKLLTAAFLLLVVSISPASTGCSDLTGGGVDPECVKQGGGCNNDGLLCCSGLTCEGGTCLSNPN